MDIIKFTQSLEQRLKELEKTDTEPYFRQTGKILTYIRELLRELKQFTADYQFQSTAEEIQFFKHHKPVLLSQFYHYKRLFSIQLFDAFRDRKSRMANYTKALKKMQVYMERNKDFYEYCMSGSDYLDTNYFTRQQRPMTKVNEDEIFTTGYDTKLAKILANEMVKTYVFNSLGKLNNERSQSDRPALIWTAQKVELVELIYGLQAVGCFNNAAPDVRKIVEVFETAFDIDLGNYYRTFVALRMRKNGYTSFLDKMKERLEQRINEIEER